jgi:hypothetical protein
VLVIALPSLESTRRESPQLEHVKSRGRVEASTMPVWAQEGQAILSITGIVSVGEGRSTTPSARARQEEGAAEAAPS